MKFIRPDTSATGSRTRPKAWDDVDGRFVRDRKGKGSWNWNSVPPEPWIGQHAGLHWALRPNVHGHIGIFPEQQENWNWISDQISGDPIEVLNLFGYTGGSTLAAAAAGAKVCHLDASRSSVKCARANANSSDLGDAPIRWIIDDAMEFLLGMLRSAGSSTMRWNSFSANYAEKNATRESSSTHPPMAGDPADRCGTSIET